MPLAPNKSYLFSYLWQAMNHPNISKITTAPLRRQKKNMTKKSMGRHIFSSAISRRPFQQSLLMMILYFPNWQNPSTSPGCHCDGPPRHARPWPACDSTGSQRSVTGVQVGGTRRPLTAWETFVMSDLSFFKLRLY